MNQLPPEKQSEVLDFVFFLLGQVLVIVSLATDPLGIGNGTGIGWKQILGAVVGVMIVVGGGCLGWGKAGIKKI